MRNAGSTSLLALLLTVIGVSASAQSPTPPAEIHAWLSGGLGSSKYFETGGGGALRTSGALSYRRVVAMVRNMELFEGIDGWTSNDESAVLIGLSARHPGMYLTSAIGVGHAHWHDELPCERHFAACSDPAYNVNGSTLAYDFGLHADKRVIGLAVNVSGALGPPKTSLIVLALSLELGWFGR